MSPRSFFSWERLSSFFFAALIAVGGVLLSRSLKNQDVQTQESIGHVLSSAGKVQVRQRKFSGWLGAHSDMALFDRTTVYTEELAWTQLQVRGLKIQVNEKTLIQILDPQRRTEIAMDFGTLLLRSRKDEEIIVHLGGKQIRLKGANSTVRIDRDKKGAARVAVVDGKVTLRQGQEPAQTVHLGESVTMQTEKFTQAFVELPNERWPAQELPGDLVGDSAPPPFVPAAEEPAVPEPVLVQSPPPAPARQVRKTAMPPTPPPMEEPETASRPLPAPPLSAPAVKKSFAAKRTLELGLGGNYVSLSESSNLTTARIEGFSAPSLFVQGEGDFSKSTAWKVSFLDIRSKLKSDFQSRKTEIPLNWKTMSLGVGRRGFWIFPRVEAGLALQEIPLIYDNGEGLQGENAQTGSVYLGFDAVYALTPKTAIWWNQRGLIPVSSKASGSLESFRSLLGIDGTLSLYHCLNARWALGFSWFGQYTQARFSIPSNGALKADEPSLQMLNSNLQLRLMYGECGQE